MTRALQWVLIGVVVLATGCVAAYDPSAPSRFGIATRAEEVGTEPARPAVERRPLFWRWRKVFGTRAEVAQAERSAPAAAPPTEPPPGQAPSATPPPSAPAAQAPSPAAAAPTEVAAAAEAIQPRLNEPAAAIPDTPAGRQLAWWIAVMRGATTRGLEMHFNPEFLKKVPASQLREVSRQWRRDEFADGPVELARLDQGPTPDRLTALIRGVNTDRYTQVKLGVDRSGLISTLWLGPVVGIGHGDITSWAQLDARFRQFPGTISFAAAALGENEQPRDVHLFQADKALAIGSAFKLYVLGALAEDVGAGRAKWDEPLAIKDDWKSLPSGRMQLETEGSEFPLSEYADLMISISDNTATDHLLYRVGRANVEAYNARIDSAAAMNRPFLSTMEMFRIKLGPDRTLADRYAKADENTRRAMLEPGGDVAKSIPSFAAIALWKAPYHIEDVEWFATARDMCRVMADLHRLEQQPGMEEVGHALRINPGLQFDPGAWKSVAYKGGSEPGVLNMTWLLRRADDRWFAVALTWNNTKEDVDLKAAADVAGAAVKLLGEERY